MREFIAADICVLGAGSAGLSVAAGAAQMGARTVLIEAARMGGDCLNTGCVPSKALLAAAKAAQQARDAWHFGIGIPEPMVDFAAVRDHLRRVIAEIAPHDSQERFESLGCRVIRAPARFVDDRTVTAGTSTVRARRFVIATGSRAAVPPIPGLDRLPYLTNETLFDLEVLPSRLLVIGAGPIGCEMAQAFRRLGAEVTVVDQGPMLPRDDPEAAAVVRTALLGEGVRLLERAAIARADSARGGIALTMRDGGGSLTGSHLLVATGRTPNTEGLNLEAAGIDHGPKGIHVDTRLRTTNRRVFAAGDVAGGPQFTHVAGYHAGIVLRNALFRLPARIRLEALPWTTYTDPELAQIGLTATAARERHGDAIAVLRSDFSDNDRARTERRSEGFAKAVVDRRGRVLGATVVGHNAGELIQPWGLLIAGRRKVGTLATSIAPYPTLSEINKRTAGNFYKDALFSQRTRWLVRFLGRFG